MAKKKTKPKDAPPSSADNPFSDSSPVAVETVTPSEPAATAKARKPRPKKAVIEKEGPTDEQLATVTNPHNPIDCNYEVITIDRKWIKNAPYNPRIISDKARDKIKGNLAKVGLMGPITWNKTTGNIVGGHQRLSCVDLVTGHGDYSIRVAAVELSDKQEKEQNIFMNNPEAQGSWDLEALEKLFSVDKLDFDAAGFDLGEIHELFGDAPIIAQPEALADFAERIRAAQERYTGIAGDAFDRDNESFYNILIHRSFEDRAEFLSTLELSDGTRYIDVRAIWAWMRATGGLAEDSTEGLGDEDHYTLTIPRCPRCQQKHKALVIRPLAQPGAKEPDGFTTCPTTGHPIILDYEKNKPEPEPTPESPPSE